MIYLDAGPIMRLIAGPADLRKQVRDLMTEGRSVTSVISVTECQTKPYQDSNTEAIRLFADFFKSADIRLIVVSDMIADAAAGIRSRYRLKTPDALHLATALIAGCELFVTTDRHFDRCRDAGVAIHIVSA